MLVLLPTHKIIFFFYLILIFMLELLDSELMDGVGFEKDKIIGFERFYCKEIFDVSKELHFIEESFSTSQFLSG